MSKTSMFRVRKNTMAQIRKALPDMKDPDRFDILFNTSAVKIEGILKQHDFKDTLGKALYGKAWKTKKR